MAINVKKSCCLRIGPCYDTVCVNLLSLTRSVLQWVDTIRYLGVHFVGAKYFKCSLDYAKCAFHHAANYIFCKIGRIASEETVIQLIKGKCLPILLYGIETYPLKKTDLRSLYFVIDRFFMKLFKTNNIATGTPVRQSFEFELPSVTAGKRATKFQAMFRTNNRNLDLLRLRY